MRMKHVSWYVGILCLRQHRWYQGNDACILVCNNDSAKYACKVFFSGGEGGGKGGGVFQQYYYYTTVSTPCVCNVAMLYNAMQLSEYVIKTNYILVIYFHIKKKYFKLMLSYFCCSLYFQFSS